MEKMYNLIESLNGQAKSSNTPRNIDIGSGNTGTIAKSGDNSVVTINGTALNVGSRSILPTQ